MLRLLGTLGIVSPEPETRDYYSILDRPCVSADKSNLCEPLPSLHLSLPTPPLFKITGGAIDQLNARPQHVDAAVPRVPRTMVYHRGTLECPYGYCAETPASRGAP